MKYVNAASVINDEIERIKEEQDAAFRRLVREKIQAIAATTQQLDKIQQLLSLQRSELAGLSYNPLDPVAILGTTP